MDVSKTNIKKSFKRTFVVLIFSAIITFCAIYYFSIFQTKQFELSYL
uniref:Uncharacterized protein n=1 Tax=viral metagenome TaxID=1070528 RepID=A0A6C0LFX3_9ZZZZ